MDDVSQRVHNLSSNKKWLFLLKELEAELDAVKKAQKEPIAIIGMGCRFPGDANDPESYWQFLRQGGDAAQEIPLSRWNIDAYYHPDASIPGKMTTRSASFVNHPDQFDAAFFGIAPREAAHMDPQQRLLLEVSWEALEHAGIAPSSLHGTRTGVFIGISSCDYAQLQATASVPLDAYSGTGRAFCVAAGRISYILGLQGPSMSIDTACSSSLVAAHLACHHLRTKECNLALVGGVNLLLAPDNFVYYSKLQALAPDGRCKTFDASANGYGRGEGCGVVVLKRLSDALTDKDPILAVIQGSAVNHDGRSSGLTAPNGLAQQQVIQQALTDAGIKPAQVGYVETHGTGTRLGDPIEVQALATVMGEGRQKEQPLLIGSVKTNIGHTESAAGIASIIKVVQMLRYKEIPGLLHLRERNPYIAWDELAVDIPTTLTPWEQEQRIAGISAFGFSGTNAHLLLQEPPIQAERQLTDPAPAHASYLFPLSARSATALRDMSHALARFLTQVRIDDALASIGYTLGTKRDHHHHRLAVHGTTATELSQRLEAFATQTSTVMQDAADHLALGSIDFSQHTKIAFVFPGQGGQWLGMGREIWEQEPVFRAAIQECDTAMRPYIDWSLTDQLLASEAQSRLAEINIAQPLIFAVQIGLARLWRSWGIEPDAVVGHSMGEVAAAHIAGILTLNDACCIICLRSQLLRQVRGQGTMLMVDLPLPEVTRLIEPYKEHVAIAVINSSRSIVLSGEHQTLTTLVERLEQQQNFYRWLQVDVASHSPQMEALRDPLAHALRDIQPHTGNISLFSTVDTCFYRGPELDATYWMRNLRQPVQFCDATYALAQEGYTLFLELSPHPTLVTALKENLAFIHKPGNVLGSLHRERSAQETLIHTLGQLYTHGQTVHWANVYPAQSHRIDLPTYSWQHERFWFEEPTSILHTAAAFLHPTGHPLLGTGTTPATQPGSYLWEHVLDLATLPYLSDHRVRDDVVVPAAVFVEMMHAAAHMLSDAQQMSLSSLSFEKMLLLTDTQSRTLQTVVTHHQNQQASVQIFSLADDSTTRHTASWILHARGTINEEQSQQERPVSFDIASLKDQCPQTVDVQTFYQQVQEHGVTYGASFQGIQEIWCGQRSSLIHLLPLEKRAHYDTGYLLHPVLLDTALQSIGAALSQDALHLTYLPTRIEHIEWYTDTFQEDLWAYARLHADGTAADHIKGDVLLLNTAGDVLLSVSGLSCQVIEQAVPESATTQWLYTMEWQASVAGPVPSVDLLQQPKAWLVFADEQHGISRWLQNKLEAQGARCIFVTQKSQYARLDERRYALNPEHPEAFSRLLKECSSTRIQGILYCWGLDVKDAPSLESSIESAMDLQQAQLSGSIGLLSLVQALLQTGWRDKPRLWIITSEVFALSDKDQAQGIAQSPLWGLSRVLNYEHAELNSSCIDLSATPGQEELDALWQEIQANDREDQIALRDQRRFLARLTHYDEQSNSHKNGRPRVRAGNTPFHVEIDHPGILDSVVLREMQRPSPGPHEVEIKIQAAGLNFLDVLSAMGMRPDVAGGSLPLFGIECSGIITRIGEDVHNLQPGQHVLAIAPGCLGSYTLTTQELVIPKPETISFEEAACIPVPFLTAYYALVQVGHLNKGERVLIHSAAGGVGLAAVQLAQQIGADVFATAGSPEKRDYLHALGISHVMDSRSLAFADEIMAVTEGRGVDVALNALSGEALVKTLEVMAPYGRFLEIGKRDIYQNRHIGLWPFHKNLTYAAIDLASMFKDRAAFCGQMLRDLVAQFAEGTLHPLPGNVFHINQADEAIRYMAQARHIGKIALSLTTDLQDIWIDPLQAHSQQRGIHAEGTYLITGGTGAIGLLLAERLFTRGARHLALLNRSMPDEQTNLTLQSLRAQGLSVCVLQADVSNLQHVQSALKEIAATMPPLVGIFHAAGLLEDALLLKQTRQSFERVQAPKILGAWNLHTATRHLSLEHFVLFSSAASLLGGPGQSNYASANAFLDALAHYRRATGLTALSVNWGPWTRVGLAAAQANRGQRIAARGMDGIEPKEGLDIVEMLLAQQDTLPAQIGVFHLNIRQWCQFYPKVAETPLFQALLTEQHVSSAKTGTTRRELEALEPDRKQRYLEQHLREQIALVLKLDPTRIEPQANLERLGFDSLTAIELRNRLEVSLDLSLPATLIWAYPTLTTLVTHLLQKLAQSSDDDPQESASEEDDSNDVLSTTLARIEHMPEHDLEIELATNKDVLSHIDFSVLFESTTDEHANNVQIEREPGYHE